MNDQSTPPVVMVFAGHDPTGGAGIQADIEVLASLGCHAAPVITALTVQDTTSVKRFQPVDSSLVIEQARAVLEDMPVVGFKLGMLGSVENIEVIHTLLMDYAHLPVVLDPVLASGADYPLANDDIIAAMVSLLFPLTKVLTPNGPEAHALAPESDNLDACAHQLLESGCEHVLITGGHEKTDEVINTLYGNMRCLQSYAWERLPVSFHGSGCTLASAIAALLAQGLDPLSAVHEAQQFTWLALNHGYRVGMGQYLPDRFFWAGEGDEEEGEIEGETSE